MCCWRASKQSPQDNSDHHLHPHHRRPRLRLLVASRKLAMVFYSSTLSSRWFDALYRMSCMCNSESSSQTTCVTGGILLLRTIAAPPTTARFLLADWWRSLARSAICLKKEMEIYLLFDQHNKQQQTIAALNTKLVGFTPIARWWVGGGHTVIMSQLLYSSPGQVQCITSSKRATSWTGRNVYIVRCRLDGVDQFVLVLSSRPLAKEKLSPPSSSNSEMFVVCVCVRACVCAHALRVVRYECGVDTWQGEVQSIELLAMPTWSPTELAMLINSNKNTQTEIDRQATDRTTGLPKHNFTSTTLNDAVLCFPFVVEHQVSPRRFERSVGP